jgi:uncharacterized repeat protein (TIGR03803 family)
MQGKRLYIGLRAVAAIVIAGAMIGRAAAQTEQVLYAFNGASGSDSISGLIFDGSGNLYGTTYSGGTSTNCGGGCGTVFELTPVLGGGWTETVLYSFGSNSTDGTNPQGNLIFDAVGNLYGTTELGGAYRFGTVFELTPTSGGWTEKLLHSFRGSVTKDGYAPLAGLAFDGKNFYGTTQLGGAYNYGVVFELVPTKSGGWSEKVLHTFKNKKGDGAYPYASLILDATGNLYSTTSAGGTNGGGTVFELTPGTGGVWTETILYSFKRKGAVGFAPESPVIFDAKGNLYGTTLSGGSGTCNYGCGTAFELTPAVSGSWTETVLHTFSNNGADGYYPLVGGLIFDTSGNLYGTTRVGGASDYGTVFELSPTSGTWTETVLYSFAGGADGANPDEGLIMDSADNLYGTTSGGGTSNLGTVFEVTP